MAFGSLRWLILPLAGVLSLIVAWSEYAALRTIELQSPVFAPESVGLLWGGWSGLQRARAMETGWRQDPAAAENVLIRQLQRYPLDRLAWHDLAVISRHLGRDRSAKTAHLEAAVAVQPGHRELRWRAATMSQVLGDEARAEEHLRRWLDGQPAATGRALFAANRWIHDPDALLERLLPDGEAYLQAAIAHARSQNQLDLAQAAWARLEQPRDHDDRALLDFVDLSLANGDLDTAMASWQWSFPDYRPGDVPNGDFQHDLGSARGLHWDTRMPAGVRSERDHENFVSAPASLRIDFDGRENVRLRSPRVRIPLEDPAERWTLSGFWRGEGLTTRALPYLSAWLEGGRRARLDVPGANFDWTPFELEMSAPEAARLVQLEFRRDPPARDFDRFIAGSLWIDALRIQPVRLPPASVDESAKVHRP